MKTRLLKINAMKRFAKWLDINSVHLSLWLAHLNNPFGKVYLGLEKRQKQANQRDKFWENRCRTRPSYNDPFVPPRVAQYSKAQELLAYINERKSR